MGQKGRVAECYVCGIKEEWREAARNVSADCY